MLTCSVQQSASLSLKKSKIVYRRVSAKGFFSACYIDREKTLQTKTNIFFTLRKKKMWKFMSENDPTYESTETVHRFPVIKLILLAMIG